MRRLTAAAIMLAGLNLLGAGIANAGYATGGAGQHIGDIFWLDWIDSDFANGKTKTFTLPGNIVVQATITNIVGGALNAYTPGGWEGDTFDDLYSGTGPVGIHGCSGCLNKFDMTFSANVDGQSVPFDVVTADAEDSGPSEYIKWTTNGSTWQVIETFHPERMTLGFSNSDKAIRSSGKLSSHNGTTLSVSRGVSVVNVEMKGQGSSAMTFGVFLSFDHGDAPSSYGDTQHSIAQNYAGGGNPTPGIDNTIDPVSSLTVATITNHTTRYLGANAPDGEGTALYSAGADGDDTTNVADEDGVVQQQSPNATPPQPWTDGTAGGRVQVTVTGGDAWLVGVFDFNRDGQYDTSGGSAEVAINQAISAGTHSIDFDIPVGTFPGSGTAPVYARFRLFASQPTSPTAAAFDGEVEEYRFGATLDFGDAPKDMTSIDADLSNAYPTLLADNGPRHSIVAGVHLGALIDGEWDGQPGLDADGDDTTGQADEDGVAFNQALNLSGNVVLSGEQNTLEVTASVAGHLSAWFDYNQNGSFTDGGEQIFNDQAVTAGANTLHFTTPDTAPHGATYMRFRFSTGAGESNTPTGAAPDGEVEDYKVELALPRAASCAVDLVNGGFEAPVGGGLLQAAVVPGWGFNADDPNAGANFAQRNTVEIWINNQEGVRVYEGAQFAEINGFVNGNLYQDMITVPGQTMFWQFAHAGRWGTDTMALRIGPPGATTEITQATDAKNTWGLYTGSYTVPAGQTITRFEFQAISSGGTTDPSIGNFVDAIHFNLACDFGDAIATYPVTGANAASHIIGGPFLGTVPDAEGDGQPSVDADGDDLNGATPDDEDGVTGFANPVPGLSSYVVDVAVHNPGASPATLFGWIDFDGDGLFEASEVQTLAIVAGDSGAKQLTWPNPVFNLQPGKPVYTRFRITTDTLSDNGGTAADERAQGPAGDGEVEDHIIDPVGNLVIAKSAIGADGAFAFTSGQLPDFSLTTSAGSASRTFAGQRIGNYDVTETVPSGWDLTSATCDNGNVPPHIVVGVGETVTCTFNNRLRTGAIVIKKATAPSGGTGFGFTQTIDGSGPFTLDDGGGKTYANVVPGNYSVTENDPSVGNYRLSGLTCTDPGGNSSTDIGALTANITLDAGETVTCTFTNTEQDGVIIEKVTVPATAAGSFSFSQTVDGSGNFSLNTGQSKHFEGVATGTGYTVTEDDPGTGFVLTDIQCHDSASGATTPGDVANRTATFDLTRVGEVVHCVFTNTALGGITILKETAPSGGTGFGFSQTIDGSGDFTLDDSQSKVFANLAAGDYSITEADPAASGYDLTALVCTSDQSVDADIDVSGRSATIHLADGENVTCTYTNTKEGAVVVEKVTEPATAGGSFTFTQDLDASGDFHLGGGQNRTFEPVPAGTYTIGETDPGAEFDVTAISCLDAATGQTISGDLSTGEVSFDIVVPGDQVHCTFTNTQRGTVVIKKVTAPGGGTGFGFGQNIDGADPFSLDDGGSKTFANVRPGAYDVTEDDPSGSGYALSGLTCTGADSTTDITTRTATIRVNPGELVTCTYTNTEQDTVVVEKITDPVGAPGVFTFSQDIDASGDFDLGGGDSQPFSNVTPGTYTVTETDLPAGFDLTAIDCYDTDSGRAFPGSLVTGSVDLTLSAGERVHCVFTNTRHGAIVIEKATAPGGSTAVFGFGQTIDATGAFTLRDTERKTFSNLTPGAYSVTEDDPTGVGFALSGLLCDDANSTVDLATRKASIQLDAGETVTCTYTNTARDTVVVEKVTDPVGAPDTFTFSQTIDASGGFDLDGGQYLTFDNVAAGRYSITEADPGTGFDLTRIDCHDTDSGRTFPGDLSTRTATLDMTLNERVHCTFTNTQRGAVIIQKVTAPSGGSGFGFGQNIDGSGTFSLDDGDLQFFIDILPGSYAVTEDVPPEGYALTGITCSDSDSSTDLASRKATIRVGAGETVTCTFTNTEQDSIVVEKVTIPAGAAGSFTFSQNVDGSGDFSLGDGGIQLFFDRPPGSYTITETDPGSNFDLIDIDCHDTVSGRNFAGNTTTGSVTLDLTAGERVHCTFTNAEAGETIPPVNTVDGTVYIDANGNGQLDPGIDHPISNVDVEITKSDNTVETLTTDANGHFSTSTPAGATIVDVDQTDPDFPDVTGLTIDTWGEGTDPTTVNVPDGGIATDNTGYVAGLDCNVICDVEPDGDVDRADIVWIFGHRGQQVSPPGADNSGDCNGDGVVSVNDARACQAFYH